MNYWWLVPVVAFISLSLTAVLRRYALHRRIIDIPNARSSHSVPTPRGGGLSIVFAFLAVIPYFAWTQMVPTQTLIALGGAGGFVAVIGFMDDHGHIPARWRLVAHFSAATWAVFWIGGLPPVDIYGHTIDLGWIGHAFGVVYLVWMLNLYNFMDGIDGIASVEALCSCLGACMLYWIGGFGGIYWPPLILAMAVVGFLYWNFPPARIFMGDAGSGFLGITLGIISLQAAWYSPQLLWSWLILLGVFIVDATFTLIRRLIQGQKVYEAHRTHAYQYASRKAGKHLPVTLAVAAINLFWLLPIAISAVVFELDGISCLVLAYLPLIGLALVFNAGKTEKPSLRCKTP